MPFTLTAEDTENNWYHTLAVDLKGVGLCMKYEILQMLEQGGGSTFKYCFDRRLLGAGESGAVRAYAWAGVHFRQSAHEESLDCSSG